MPSSRLLNLRRGLRTSWSIDRQPFGGLRSEDGCGGKWKRRPRRFAFKSSGETPLPLSDACLRVFDRVCSADECALLSWWFEVIVKGRVLIAGCGFVGQATARLFHHSGWEVAALTHSAESAASLRGEPFAVEPCDLTDPKALAKKSAWQGMDAVIHCASSGRGGADAYRAVYLDGSRNLFEILAPRSLVFSSSTSVYAQADGSWVDEESAALPQVETGRLLRETEQFVVNTGGIVARVAGIYGPGRSVLLRKFFAGEALIDDGGERFLNQVHRDDVATALLTLVTAKARGVFNVADDQPEKQRALYQWLAERFARPLPPSVPRDLQRKRGWTNKRVSNTRLRALGWSPRYPSFRTAIDEDPELLVALSIAPPNSAITGE